MYVIQYNILDIYIFLISHIFVLSVSTILQNSVFNIQQLTRLPNNKNKHTGFCGIILTTTINYYTYREYLWNNK